MRTSYLFLCVLQPQREFEKTCFVQATKNSLRLFPIKRASLGLMQLSFMGIISPYIIGVLTMGTLVPRWFNIYWVFLPGLILLATKAWPWAQRIAFRYTERRTMNGEELQVHQVKAGALRQTLQVETGGRKATLIIQCRRRSLARALELASPVPREEGY